MIYIIEKRSWKENNSSIIPLEMHISRSLYCPYRERVEEKAEVDYFKCRKHIRKSAQKLYSYNTV